MNVHSYPINRFTQRLVMAITVALLVALGTNGGIIPSLAAPDHAITVTNANDDGEGSLRQAISDVSSGQAINFNGDYEIILQSELSVDKNLLIDGAGHTITINGNQAVRLFHIISGTVILNHLILSNGYVGDETEGDAYGGGLFNDGTLMLNDCTVANNSTWTVSGSSVGGGIVNYGDLTLNDSVVANNYVSTVEGLSMGGGIANYGTLTMNLSTVFANTSDWMGAGIYNEGILAIHASRVSNNIAFHNSGGGIYSFVSSLLTVSNSIFAGNTAGWGGAIANYGAASIINSTFSRNLATEPGGLGFGGGFYNEFGSILIVNSTLFGNSASVAGGGVFDSNGGTTLKNTLITDSPLGGNCATHPSGGTIANGGNNLDSGDTCGWGQDNGSMSNTDPKLGVITDGIFPLNSESPAINAVTWNAPNDCPATDQRGLARPVDALCDIGAIEYQSINAPGITQPVSGPGIYAFEPMGVTIEVVDTGGCLTDLTVAQRDFNHPNATVSIQTQRYWHISSTGCTSGFNVNLTLPVNAPPDEDNRLCRYVGNEQIWDCAMSTHTEHTITRIGVTGFSDWAAGDESGPTAVKLTTMKVWTPNANHLIGVALISLILAGGLWLFGYYRLLLRKSYRIAREHWL